MEDGGIQRPKFLRNNQPLNSTTSKRVTATSLLVSQSRLRALERQIEGLNALPRNSQIIDQMLSEHCPDADQRAVTDLWQSLQLRRRVDANSEGLDRVSNDLRLVLRSGGDPENWSRKGSQEQNVCPSFSARVKPESARHDLVTPRDKWPVVSVDSHVQLSRLL